VFDLTPVHIVVLVAVLLLVFGSRRLPEVGRSLGQGLRDFKREVSAGFDEAAQPAPAASTESDPVVENTPDARQENPASTSPANAVERTPTTKAI
jgi:sec-independent protein translocase protein TatA